MKILLSPNSRNVYDSELVDQNSSAYIINQLKGIGRRLFASEQLITPEAITTTVLGAVTFQSFMEGFEPFMEKSNTAPSSPALNDLWYDTSVTPNMMKRWSGSAWINSTFTQTQIESTATSIANSAIASYDAETVAGLESRISSAETKLTASAIVNTVRDSVTYKSDLSALVPTTVLTTTLASYPTTTAVNSTLAGYVPTTVLDTTLASYVPATTLDTTLASYVPTTVLDTTLASYVPTTTLASYPTTTAVNTTLNNYPTNTALGTTLANYPTNTALGTTLAGYPTNTALDTTLSGYPTNTALGTTLANYPTASQVDTNLASALTNYSTTTLANSALAQVLSTTLANYSTTTQTSDSLNFAIGSVNTTLTTQGLTITEVKATFQFLLAGLVIGRSSNAMKLWLANDKMAFITNPDPTFYTFVNEATTPVMYITTNKMFIKTIEVTSSLVVGSHKIYKDTALGYTLVQKVG